MKLVFLGRLADLAQTDEASLDRGRADWAALCRDLEAEFGQPLVEAIRGHDVKVAVDGRLLADKTALVAGADAEVAFLPPVSGG